jgi:hypothetical protein
MLGTEYNWLIATSTLPDGTPRVRLASTGLLTLAVGACCFLGVAMRAEPAHRVLMQEAAAAAKANDTATVIIKLEKVRALRPDYPRVLNNLARFYLQANRPDDAVRHLLALAAMGVKVDITLDGLRRAARAPAIPRTHPRLRHQRPTRRPRRDRVDHHRHGRHHRGSRRASCHP